jgi:cytochrome P450
MRNNWSGQTFAHPERRRPWVGDMFSMDINRPMQHIMRHHRGLGPLFELRVFGQKFVFVTDAELAHELNDEGRFEKALSPALVALRDFAGDGLFTAYNDEASWYHAHTLLMPAFSKQAMQSYHPVMLQAATELFSYWDARPGPIDVSSDMTKLTMETIGRAAFSQDFGSFTRPDPHPFVDAMVAALKAGREKGSLETMPGSKLLLRRLDRRNAPRLAYVERFLDGIIAARRANGEESTGDLLGIMLDDDIGDVNIRHQILTFLVAGHETTSGALSFALYYLSRDPEVLRRAQEETDAVLGPDRDVLPTYEQVARFR